MHSVSLILGRFVCERGGVGCGLAPGVGVGAYVGPLTVPVELVPGSSQRVLCAGWVAASVLIGEPVPIKDLERSEPSVTAGADVWVTGHTGHATTVQPPRP